MKLNPWIFRWHGHLGVIASIFVIILIVTGIALNHTERLQLDAKFIDQNWLLSWYGIGPESAPVSFQIGENWLTEVDGRLFLDGVAISSVQGAIVGAVGQDGLIVAATEESLFLFDETGDLIEQIGQVPWSIRRLGTLEDAFGIQSDVGNFLSTDNLISWQETNDDFQWATKIDAPEEVTEAVLLNFRGIGLPWERVMLDLHSGRIFGRWGSYVMDGAALVLLILVVSGAYNWAIRR